MLLYVHSVDPHEEYEPEPNYLAQFADPQRHPRFREEWKKLLASRPPIPGLYVTQDNFDRTGVDSASFIAHASNLYDADIRAKLFDAGRDLIDAKSLERLAAMVEHIEEVDDVADLLALVGRPAVPASR
jgi:hypothetical protein